MIKYNELSWPLKVAVVSAWTWLIYMVLAFSIGFIQGAMEGIYG